MNIKTYLVVLTMTTSMLDAAETFGGSVDDKPLTLDLAKEVWNAPYEYPLYKFEAVSKFMKRIEEVDRVKGTNDSEVSAMKAYFLNAVLQTPVATVDDQDHKISGIVLFYGRFVNQIIRWECMQKPEIIRQVARSLGRFRPLPEFDYGEAAMYAQKVDELLKHGDNNPHSNETPTGRWSGPVGERVSKVSNFRKLYNQGIRSMRESVADVCRWVIFNKMDKSLDEASRQALWEEFALESGVNPKDWAGK